MIDLNDKNTGDELTADEWNQMPSELQNFIQSSGQTLSGSDLHQVTKATATYSAASTFYDDQGSSNNYDLVRTNGLLDADALVDGFQVHFIAANSSNAQCSISLPNVAGKPLLSSIGETAAGLILKDQTIIARYSSLTDDFRLITERSPYAPSASRNCVTNQDPLSQGTATRKGMASKIYTGNGTSQSINNEINMNGSWGGVGEQFGGLVWAKKRSGIAPHVLLDTVRGTGVFLSSESTSADIAANFNSFDSDGFTLGTDANDNADDYISWAFQTTHRTSGVTNRNKPYTAHYNATMGFSIVGFDHSTSGQEVPTFLGAPAELTITKRREEAATNWIIFTQGYALNFTTSAGVSSESEWLPQADNMLLSGTSVGGVEDAAIISYNFASVEFVSKVGSYIGTGAVGNYIDCGFGDKKAGFVLAKNITQGGSSWIMVDAVRGKDTFMQANSTNAEDVTVDLLDFVAGGFVLSNTVASLNIVNNEYIFLAFADNSGSTGITGYEYPTSADEITVNNQTNISFAKGSAQIGENNFLVTVGGGKKITLGSGFENKKLYLYADSGSVFGATEFRPIEGTSRAQADKWGLASPLGGDTRATAKHFDFESSTGVASASDDNGGTNPSYNAFNLVTTGAASESDWLAASTTTSTLQYKQTERRILKSWRIRDGQTAGRVPRRFTVEGSDDGLNWTAIDSTYTASDYISDGARLWGDLHDTSGNTTAYLYHRLDITANSGDGSLTGLGELELNTITPSDFYDIIVGEIYDESDAKIQRVYLGECTTGSLGEVLTLKNNPVAPTKVDSGEYQGNLKVHGEIQNRGICTAWVNFDGEQNPPLIRDSYNVAAIGERGTGDYVVYFESPMDNSAYSVSGASNRQLTAPQTQPQNVAFVRVVTTTDGSVISNASDVSIQIFGGKEIQ